MCREQDSEHPACRPVSTTARSQMAVVTYCLERHDWSPALGSNTTILTIADWFFKAAPFVAFPNLPTALETDKILTQHVFSQNGIPQGIVSDRGPHFTSQVWREICSELGAQVSLSIGFPQTNGQAERAKQEQSCGAAPPPSRPRGATSWCGWNTPTTPEPRWLLEFLHLSRVEVRVEGVVVH